MMFLLLDKYTLPMNSKSLGPLGLSTQKITFWGEWVLAFAVRLTPMLSLLAPYCTARGLTYMSKFSHPHTQAPLPAPETIALDHFQSLGLWPLEAPPTLGTAGWGGRALWRL